MNLVASAPAWVLAIFALLLIAAAVEDAARLRISNLTSLGVLTLAVVTILLGGFSVSLWQNAAVLALFLVVGTLMFAAGQLGGGDVKLLAALGAWVNLKGAFALLSCVFLAGGVLALGYIVGRRSLGRSPVKARKGSIPYGVAIVVGAFVTFAFQLGLI